MVQCGCRRGYSLIDLRIPHRHEILCLRHRNGALDRWLLQRTKTNVLVMDNGGMDAIDGITRSDLLGIIEERTGNKTTVIAHQLPLEHR